MARKRGGLAGLYDRNKGVIQKAAPVVAGMFGGPLAGAAVGAAIRGLDREGKSGIGFDVGQGIRGGAEGYLGGSAGKGIKTMFTAGLKNRAAAEGAKGLAEGTKSLNAIPLSGATVSPLATAPAIPPATLPPSATSRFSQVGKLFGKNGAIENNKTLIAGIGKGIAGVRSDDLEQQQAEDVLNERKRQFDLTYGIDAAKEAERLRLEKERDAQRAAFRAMFAGGM